MRRTLARFEAVERGMTPPDYLLKVGDAPHRAYDALQGGADSYGRFDNNVPRDELPQRIEGAGLLADTVPASASDGSGRGGGRGAAPRSERGPGDQPGQGNQADAAAQSDSGAKPG